MRAAVLQFAFDQLGALRARSSAFVDNPASRRVSDRLGYRRRRQQVRWRAAAQPAELIRLLLNREHFVRPEWTIETVGVAECRGSARRAG